MTDFEKQITQQETANSEMEQSGWFMRGAFRNLGLLDLPKFTGIQWNFRIPTEIPLNVIESPLKLLERVEHMKIQ